MNSDSDDTALGGLTSNGDESTFRCETDHLVTCSGLNNLELSTLKKAEMVVDLPLTAPLTSCDSSVPTA